MTSTAGAHPPPRHAAQRVRDHWWWRPGWHAGRRFYTWHLTFDGQQDLHRLVRGYQAHLHLPALDLLPLPWLHLTVQGVGFTDQVSQRDLRAVVAAAAERCARVAPFPLALGPAAVGPEGVKLRVLPAAPVERLRATLREAIAAVWGAGQVPEAAEGFSPHVSVAYSNAEGPAAPLIARVERAGPQQATVTIRAAQLLDLERDTHVYRWKTQATVPLLAEGTAEHTQADPP